MSLKYYETTVPWVDNQRQIKDCRECELSRCDDRCSFKWFHNAVEYVRNGDDISALKCLEVAQNDAPYSYDLHYLKGVIYERLGKKQDALMSFKKAYDVFPRRTEALWGLALVYAEIGAYDQSLEFCDKYDELAKDHALDQLRKDCLQRKK